MLGSHENGLDFVRELRSDTMSYDETGRLRFFEHEFVGAKKIPAMAARLRWSTAETSRYVGYVRNHMRPGNLASQVRVTDKAIHRFFRDLGDDAIAIIKSTEVMIAREAPLGVVGAEEGPRPNLINVYQIPR